MRCDEKEERREQKMRQQFDEKFLIDKNMIFELKNDKNLDVSD